MSIQLFPKSYLKLTFQEEGGYNLSYALVAVLLVLIFLQMSPRVFYRFKQYREKKRNYDFYEDLPGPFQLPFIGAAHYITRPRETIEVFRYLAEESGRLIKFHLFKNQFVVLNNAPMLQTLLTSTDPGHLRKSPFLYDLAFSNLMANGLLPTSDIRRWKSHRKILSSCFSNRCFQNYVKIFGRCSERLVTDLHNLFDGVGENETKQINTTIHNCSLQAISEAVMGLKLCSDEDGEDYYRCFKMAKDAFGYRIHNPIFILEFFWKFHPMSRELNDAVHRIHSITKKMITKHQSTKDDLELAAADKPKEQSPLTGKTMIEEMLKSDMSEEDIMYEVCTMIVAGFETTGAAVHYLLFLLALNPEHQKLCREEILEAMADPMKCINGKLTYDGISELKYLERCFMEALRIFPPAFATIRELDKPLRLSDTLVIPKGVNVVIPPLTMNIKPENFPNPMAFDPDRHLPENVKSRHAYSFLPFSSGARNCIGNKFAIMMAKTMTSHILANFEISTVDTMSDVTLLPYIFLTPERDFNFNFKRRQL